MSISTSEQLRKHFMIVERHFQKKYGRINVSEIILFYFYHHFNNSQVCLSGVMYPRARAARCYDCYNRNQWASDICIKLCNTNGLFLFCDSFRYDNE